MTSNWLVLLSVLGVILLLLLWTLIDSWRSHRRQESAIDTLNLQVAFVAGRIGLTRRDLSPGEEPVGTREGKPAVEGDAIWDDLQERIDLLTEKEADDAARGHAVAQD